VSRRRKHRAAAEVQLGFAWYTLAAWCRLHGRKLDGAARAAYVTHLLQEASGD
jgi:hypothetical protein